MPSISKNVWCLAVLPTDSISGVRIHFWQVVTLLNSDLAAPVKKGLKGTIPAAVQRILGSFKGIREALGNLLCPLPSKNFKKLSLISLPVIKTINLP